MALHTWMWDSEYAPPQRLQMRFLVGGNTFRDFRGVGRAAAGEGVEGAADVGRVFTRRVLGTAPEFPVRFLTASTSTGSDFMVGSASAGGGFSAVVQEVAKVVVGGKALRIVF